MMKQYTCDVRISGKGTARGVVLWLPMKSSTEAKKAAQGQFPGEKIIGIYNIKEKK